MYYSDNCTYALTPCIEYNKQAISYLFTSPYSAQPEVEGQLGHCRSTYSIQ